MLHFTNFRQIALGFFLVSALANVAQDSAAEIVLTTSQGQFDPRYRNQGWWNEAGWHRADIVNYIISDQPGYHHRNFFTFDLSLLPEGSQVATSTLRLSRFSSSGNNELVETIGWFDVSTDAQTLNTFSGNDLGIFADLGSGMSYGKFEVPGDGERADILEFELNANAIDAINSSISEYFSIGGVLLSAEPGDFLFGSSSGSFVQELVVTLVPEPEPLMVMLDIKPSGDPNSINPKSKGVLPVAILSTDEFDVSDVDIDTLLFGDPLLLDSGGTAVSPLRSSFEDVSGDGLLDLILKFSTSNLVENDALGLDTLEGILTGALFDGTPIEGSDSIRIVPSNGPNGKSLQLSAIPEPSSFLLSTLALLGIACRRRV